MKRNAEYLTIPVGRGSLHTILCIALLAGQVSAADQSTPAGNDRQPTLVRRPSIAVQPSQPKTRSSRRSWTPARPSGVAPATHETPLDNQRSRARSAFDPSWVVQASAISAADNELRARSTRKTEPDVPTWTTRSTSQPANRLRRSQFAEPAADQPSVTPVETQQTPTEPAVTESTRPILPLNQEIPAAAESTLPLQKPTVEPVAESLENEAIALPDSTSDGIQFPDQDSDDGESINWTVTDQEVAEAKCVIRLFGTLGMKPATPRRQTTGELAHSEPRSSEARDSKFSPTGERRPTEASQPARPALQSDKQQTVVATDDEPQRRAAQVVLESLSPVLPKSGDSEFVPANETAQAVENVLRKSDVERPLRQQVEAAATLAVDSNVPANEVENMATTDKSVPTVERRLRRSSAYQPSYVIGDHGSIQVSAPNGLEPMDEELGSQLPEPQRSDGGKYDAAAEPAESVAVQAADSSVPANATVQELDVAETSNQPLSEVAGEEYEMVIEAPAPMPISQATSNEKPDSKPSIASGSDPLSGQSDVPSKTKLDGSGRAVRQRLRTAIDNFVRTETTTDTAAVPDADAAADTETGAGIEIAGNENTLESDTAAALTEEASQTQATDTATQIENSESADAAIVAAEMVDVPEVAGQIDEVETNTKMAAPTVPNSTGTAAAANPAEKTARLPRAGGWAEPSARRPNRQVATPSTKAEFYRITSNTPPQRGAEEISRVQPGVQPVSRSPAEFNVEGPRPEQQVRSRSMPPPKRLPLQVAKIPTGTTAPARQLPIRHEPAAKPVPEVRLAVKTSYPLQAPGRVTLATVVDQSVCEVVQQSPYEVTLVGKQEGQTEVAIWLDGERSAQVYRVVVGHGETVNRDQGKLERLLAELFPRSRVSVTQREGSVLVDGVAKNRQEAIQILSVIRSVKLIPVVDNLQLRQR